MFGSFPFGAPYFGQGPPSGAVSGASTATIVVASEGDGRAKTVIAQVGPPRRAPRFLIRRAGASVAHIRVAARGLGRPRRWGASVASGAIVAIAEGRARVFTGPQAQGFSAANGVALRTKQAVRIERSVEPVFVAVPPASLSRGQRHLLALARQSVVSPSVPRRSDDDDDAEILQLLEVA